MVAPFDSPYAHGFARVAAAVPAVALGQPAANAAATIELLHQAHDEDVAVVVFPELGLVGYSLGDLLHQDVVLRGALDALEAVRVASVGLTPLAVVGLPLRVGSQLFNVAAVLHGGHVVGVVPKSYLPNYGEFHEHRHFTAARQATCDSVRLGGATVPFGTDLLFEATDVAELVVGVEICEDLWAPVPPSSFAALAGATVLCNASASNATIAKADYRRELCRSHSARSIAAYAYAGCGVGESTTDLVWDGHAMVVENGTVLAESTRFDTTGHLVVADVDLERLVADRVRLTTFSDSAGDQLVARPFRRLAVRLGIADRPIPLRRDVARFPFVPTDPDVRDQRCAEIYAIQRRGLASRLRATGLDRVVVGVSGGLDSTQALLVAVGCMDDLGLPRRNVLAFTMPGFATSEHTLTNAHRLMEALGVTAAEVDIRPAATRMLDDIGHPAASGDAHYDVTYENVQAGARTSLLFRLANEHHALVVGTGDLSELALGWCTYGVGDHMSHYGVNAGVPKTLIQYLVRWVAQASGVSVELNDVLESILATDISPELIPGDSGAGPHQRSEDVIGPYELQDFHLYYVLRYGYRPTKVAYLAHQAWRDRTTGVWPSTIPEADRHEYDQATILRWLRVFLERFVQTAQFKRSTLPDGPKVGSVTLSPRGDWRAPSDASAALWLAELDALAT